MAGSLLNLLMRPVFGMQNECLENIETALFLLQVVSGGLC